MYINGEQSRGERPPKLELPTQTADSNRGALESFRRIKFKAFCKTHQSLQSVVSVQSIVQNEDDAVFGVTLECECTREIVQLVQRSERAKSALKTTKAKAEKAKAEAEQYEDLRALSMEPAEELTESDRPSELSVRERGGS